MRSIIHQGRIISMATVSQFSVEAPSDAASVQSYFSTLTALRAVAAIWVMLFHIDVIVYYRELGTLLPKEFSGLLTQGYLWVDFFFILSGFVLMHVYGARFEQRLSRQTISSYLKARFFRIYPLHLFTLVLLAIFAGVVGALLPQVMDASWVNYFDEQAFLSNVLMLNAVGVHDTLSWNIVAWSIGAEWWVYIAAIMLFFTVNLKHPLRTLLVAMVNFVALALLMYSSDKQNLDITFDRGLLRCLFEFSIGACLYVFYQRGIAQSALSLNRIALITLVAVIAVLHWRLNDLLIIPLFCLLILTAVYNRSHFYHLLMTPALQYLGKISYSIYMMHGVCFMLYWFLLPELAIAFEIQQLSIPLLMLYTASFLTLTLISAALSFRFIEVPGRVLFRARP
ncbi:acyltransferase [Psychrobium sp. MM17-31]|uniref:acyltransferase family protein n=1 Tax=Psychrobium sp. MM17-31 TaxID=2917758 RepID=UPI001EF642B4|nr:acyltransferase [Psychrobium sp. MM17-31]MCG7531173.1 acyltransferase [Psychrobium sp. MM17-31]